MTERQNLLVQQQFANHFDRYNIMNVVIFIISYLKMGQEYLQKIFTYNQEIKQL